ncbi:MAG TPA: hypothetical protein VFT42_01780, partial [Solirubrobacteraceae bacterium]|nr:hypothetical protein [Solirubrobacteraceae bacterium]
MTDVLAQVRAAVGERPAWLVGGWVRDRLLGRRPACADIDVVLDGEVRDAARALARGSGGAAFELSDAFGAWRVVGPEQAWQVDFTPLQGGSLEADLRARDLTVNAIAEPLGGGDPVDPTGAMADIEARRLRMVGPEAFAADPLRVMRLPRLAVELGFEADPDTIAAARAQAPGLAAVAGERIFAELKRIVGADDAQRGLELMDAVGATRQVLPELDALRGVIQNPYHHRDVHGHT